MLSDISSTEVDSSCCILDGESFIDSACMTASITNIKHDTRSQTSSIQAEHTWGVEEKFGHLEIFKEHLRRSDSVSNRVVRWLRQHDWVLSWIDFKFLEDVTPDLFHIVPVLDNAVLHRVWKLQDALEFLL